MAMYIPSASSSWATQTGREPMRATAEMTMPLHMAGKDLQGACKAQFVEDAGKCSVRVALYTHHCPPIFIAQLSENHLQLCKSILYHTVTWKARRFLLRSRRRPHVIPSCSAPDMPLPHIVRKRQRCIRNLRNFQGHIDTVKRLAGRPCHIREDPQVITYAQVTLDLKRSIRPTQQTSNDVTHKSKMCNVAAFLSTFPHSQGKRLLDSGGENSSQLALYI